MTDNPSQAQAPSQTPGAGEQRDVADAARVMTLTQAVEQIVQEWASDLKVFEGDHFRIFVCDQGQIEELINMASVKLAVAGFGRRR